MSKLTKKNFDLFSSPPKKPLAAASVEGVIKKTPHRVLLEAHAQALVGQDVDRLKGDPGRRQDLHHSVGEAALREVLRALDERHDAVLGDEVVEGGLELRGEAGGVAAWSRSRKKKKKGEEEERVEGEFLC